MRRSKYASREGRGECLGLLGLPPLAISTNGRAGAGGCSAVNFKVGRAAYGPGEGGCITAGCRAEQATCGLGAEGCIAEGFKAGFGTGPKAA